MIKLNTYLVIGIVVFAAAVVMAQPYPYTDPTNLGGWVLYEPMSDEFDGSSVDTSKWEPLSWQGRKPVEHQFDNCSVSGGELILTTDLKPGASTPVDETTYAIDSGYLQSIHWLRYGYVEIEARALDFPLVTTWWLTSGSRTYSREIDMLECPSGVPGKEYDYHCNYHVWRTPTPTGVDTTHTSNGAKYTHTWRMIDDFHIYGFEWDKDYCRIYIDGNLRRETPTDSFKVGQRLMIGNEYNSWFCPLSDINNELGSLPKTYNVRYVRTWRKPDTNVTWYVDGASGSDSNTGANWAQAKETINAALNEANNGDQIWVAAGTYQEYITLYGMRNISLYGGFSNGDTSLDDRDYFDTKLTIISSPPDGYEPVSIRSVEGVRLDGFQLTGATFDYSTGIQVDGPYDSDTVIANCIMSGNAPVNGSAGGIAIKGGYGGGPILIDNCRIVNNTCLGLYPSGGGAGLLQGNEPKAIFSQCLFEGNIAGDWGGAIVCPWNESSTMLKLINCVFADNQAGTNHAAIETNSGTLEIINCTFDNNTPETIRLSNNANLIGFILQNSTVTNSSTSGLYSNWSGITSSDGIINSLFYGNGTNVYYGSAYNDATQINSLSWADGCIVDDPLYADASSDDYHLQIVSPCIEVGLNTVDSEPFDFDGRGRIVDADCSGTATVDIGAYEFTTASYGDFAGGCDVDFGDFGVLAVTWLGDEFSVDIAPTPAGDGIVDINELIVLCENWLTGK